MNFSLQKLEAHIDESALLEGEALFEAGGVKQLFELEKHLWLAEVEAEDRYEVEVKISPSKVLAATCECEEFLKHKECSHLAAVLLKLRQYLSALKVKKQRARDAKKSTRKLTTNVILEHIKPEDLTAFVRDYAKTNRSFSLALKAKFAGQVSQISSNEKYLQLLDGIVGMARRPDRSISVRGVQKINKVLVELLGQIGDNIAIENYKEALFQIQSIIEKIPPILKKAADDKGLLTTSLKETFRALDELIQSSIPPALKADIWDYAMEESKKLVYRSNRIDINFYELLLKMTKEKVKLEQLVQHIEEQIKRYKKEDRDYSKLMLTKIHVLDKGGKKAAIRALVKENLANPKVLFYAIDQYRKQKRYDRAKSLALDGLKSSKDKSVSGKLEEVLLQLAEDMGEVDTILEFAEKRLIATLDSKYFFKIRENFSGDWEEKFAELVQTLQKLPYSMKRRDLVAIVYNEEGRKEELLAYLQKMTSIDLLKEYGPLLVQDFKKETRELYKKLLNQYLRNHIGRKPSLKIRGVIAKLMEAGEARLAESLVEEFRESYSERHSLMEELEVF